VTTLAEAKELLYEELTSVSGTGRPISSLSSVVRVYLGEPPAGEMVGPSALTISTQSLTPTEFLFVIRAYVQMGIGVMQAQAQLDDVVYQLETGLADRYQRNTWNWSYAEAFDCLVAETEIAYPRDDF
tara:strand:+ start:813 stop:1196 length:384 start_codon:yes stop_codon:yes gene_type:complete